MNVNVVRLMGRKRRVTFMLGGVDQAGQEGGGVIGGDG